MTAKSKYGSVRVQYSGLTFDSKGELNRWLQLNLMQEAGAISDLKQQVKFELCPPVRLVGERQSRSISYVADFQYVEDGKTVIEDWKGVQTEAFRIKRRLLKHVHGIDLRLTGAK